MVLNVQGPCGDNAPWNDRRHIWTNTVTFVPAVILSNKNM